MKQFIRGLLRRGGFELLHASDDPVLAELRRLHETLRLNSDPVPWDDSLPQPAMQAHLRNLLQLHRIDLVLDVGANRGQFARLVRQLGFLGRIVSFEQGKRIAWAGDFKGFAPYEPGVLEVCRGALKTFEALGCVVEEAIPDYPLDKVWRAFVTSSSNFGLLMKPQLFDTGGAIDDCRKRTSAKNGSIAA